MSRRAPLLAAPGALPLAAGLALVPLLGAPEAPAGLAVVGGAGLVLYAVALAVPWPGALTWAVALLALEYVAGLVLRGVRLDLTAPAYAAAYFLCAELGWLGLEVQAGGRLWPGRAVAIGALTLGGAGLGAVLLLVAAAPVPGSLALTALGAAAAVGIVACLAWLARR